MTARPKTQVRVLALAACLLVACAAPPEKPAGLREVLLVSEAVERDVGAAAAAQVEAELGLVESPELSGYVQALGERVLQRAPVKSFEYAFQVVDQDAPNAFALPGGLV